MKISRIAEILNADILACAELADSEVCSACGSDMMSDVLAFVKDQAVLLTGLVNTQVIRTAEILELAEKCEIVVMASQKRMYEACGLLYTGGLNNVKEG